MQKQKVFVWYLLGKETIDYQCLNWRMISWIEMESSLRTLASKI